MQQAVDTLLQQLKKSANLPFGQARAMPKGVYIHLAQSGHLCWLERPNYDFACYLSQRINAEEKVR